MCNGIENLRENFKPQSFEEKKSTLRPLGCGECWSECVCMNERFVEKYVCRVGDFFGSEVLHMVSLYHCKDDPEEHFTLNLSEVHLQRVLLRADYPINQPTSGQFSI